MIFPLFINKKLKRRQGYLGFNGYLVVYQVILRKYFWEANADLGKS